MEEKKLTDEEIVKELINESNRGEWCDLNFIDCVEVRILKNALDLINRQKAEIERLTKDKSFATRKMMESKAKAVELQTQVDELKEENETVLNRSTMWKRLHTEVCEENAELQKQVDEISETAIKNSRKETAEKFAEMLKDKAYNADYIRKDNHIYILEYFDYIDEICKEITEKGVQNGN